MFVSEKALSANVFTGSISDPLEDALKNAISNCDKLCMIASFVQVSGVRLLEDILRDAFKRGVEVKLLTGTYLGITDPDALIYLNEISNNKISIHFYKGDNSFHPKAYFTYSKIFGDCVFVGSSNLSKSALCDGIEWNYRITREEHCNDFLTFEQMFDHLWNNYSTVVTLNEIEKYRQDRTLKPIIRIDRKTESFEPNDVQILACSSLERTRSAGMNKGLVVAATGTGKTYIAALDSKNFKTVLFIVHNRKILEQARKTFEKIRPNDSYGFCYNGVVELDKNLVFATIQTIKNDKYLNKIKKDYFEYIVIDEFHHAAANSYHKVIDYFEPKFLLGLTATPERMDYKEIFSLCDNNVVYEIRLIEAIQRGFLCPFRYKGIKDIANYEKIKIVHGHYSIDSLDEQLVQESRAELIYKKYCQYCGKKTIGFCSSSKHANFMADYFVGKKIHAGAIYSNYSKGKNYVKPDEVDQFLNNDKESVLFVVDMFNEGVDIPDIDTVMFLRPTESMTVYIQQLGRGLRKCEGKSNLTVLDFIGNYRNIDMFPRLIMNEYPKCVINNQNMKKYLPVDCDVDYDLGSIDIFQLYYQRNTKISDRLRDLFDTIRKDIDHIPSRVEFYNYLPKDILNKYNKEINGIFKDYLSFLSKYGYLDYSIRKSFIGTDAGKYISCLEKTEMNRMYKIPVFLSFIKNGRMETFASFEQIGEIMKDYYFKDNNSIEFKNDKRNKAYPNGKMKDWINLAKNNPVKFLCKTDSDIFEQTNDGLKIKLNLDKYCNKTEFIEEILDIVEYRSLVFKENRYSEVLYGDKREISQR